MLFAAITISVQFIAIAALSVVCVVALVGWLFRKDTAVEHRRREMIALHAKLEGLGLERLAGFAECYAVGDYSGLYAEGKALVKQVMDADDAMGLLDKSFYLQLPKRLDREGDRERILKIIQQYQAARAEPNTAKASPAVA